MAEASVYSKFAAWSSTNHILYLDLGEQTSGIKYMRVPELRGDHLFEVTRLIGVDLLTQ